MMVLINVWQCRSEEVHQKSAILGLAARIALFFFGLRLDRTGHELIGYSIRSIHI
jgi:hypothetical protein